MCHDDVIETITRDGVIARLYQDYDPMSPAEWDTLGTLYLDSSLGYRFGEQVSTDYRDMRVYIRACRMRGLAVIPVSLSSHGTTLDLSETTDDRANGYLVATPENIELTGAPVDDPAFPLIDTLRGELRTWQTYVSGDVYGYTIETPDGEHVGTTVLWGIYGYDDAWDEMLAALEREATAYRERVDARERDLMNKRERLESRIADLLAEYGPDGHIDGYKEIADALIAEGFVTLLSEPSANMGEKKHTPEPWSGYGPCIEGGSSFAHRTVARVDVKGETWSDEERANRDRIVACVNACAGLPDPSVVPELVDALERVEREAKTDSVEMWAQVRRVLVKAGR